MALTRRTILRKVKSGEIFISDFDRTRLQGASYDVTLGKHYYRICEPTNRTIGMHCPLSKESTDQLWGKPHTAERFQEIINRYGNEIDKETRLRIPPDALVILLEPGDFILAHTNEFIGTTSPWLTPAMSAKSSSARNGFSICRCAGWGDPGYFNRWTMEIRNEISKERIILPVNMAIGQIKFLADTNFFSKVIEFFSPNKSSLYYEKGSYQEFAKHDVMSKWSPESMLPKMYKHHWKPEIEPSEILELYN